MSYIYLKEMLWEFTTIINLLEVQKQWKSKLNDKRSLLRKEQKNKQSMEN